VRTPNILWYCTDQQRYDTIAALGWREAHTPVIDGVVHRGVAFRSAYCQAPICTPSRASFLTGRYPASHHVHRNGNEQFPGGEKLVTRMFANAGWDCGLVGKLHLAASKGTREQRCDDGYGTYAWSHHPYPDIEGNEYTDWLRDAKGVDPKEAFAALTGSYGPGLPTELHQTTWCSEKSIEFIRRKRDRPWMLTVNPFAPHPTFHPPREMLERFEPSSLSYPLFRESDIEHQRRFAAIDQQTIEAVDPREAERRAGQKLTLSHDQMASIAPTGYDPRLLKACYYGEIELVDTQLGRILEALDETGQREDTIVVFMSDHGELLGDHGLLFKGCRFFEGLVHVPLIVSWPRRLLADSVSDALVELVDVAPTLLELAGIEVPYFVQGRSLAPLLEGRRGLHTHKAVVVSEYNDAMAAGTTAQGRHDASHGTMSFDGRYKTIMYHGHDVGEIYDLENDPGEFDDLWDKRGSEDLRCRLLKRHIDAIMATSDAGIRRTRAY
jgi:arylsulfatase